MYEELIAITSTSVEFPSDRQALAFKQLHAIQAPIPDAQGWHLLLLRKLAQPAPTRPPSVPAAILAQPEVNSLSHEARIRSLPTAILRQVAATNSVAYEPHATNGGLTAMRLRNALLAAVRRGQELAGL